MWLGILEQAEKPQLKLREACQTQPVQPDWCTLTTWHQYEPKAMLPAGNSNRET
jgi:hypothetical protein